MSLSELDVSFHFCLLHPIPHSILNARSSPAISWASCCVLGAGRRRQCLRLWHHRLIMPNQHVFLIHKNFFRRPTMWLFVFLRQFLEEKDAGNFQLLYFAKSPKFTWYGHLDLHALHLVGFPISWNNCVFSVIYMVGSLIELASLVWESGVLNYVCSKVMFSNCAAQC